VTYIYYYDKNVRVDRQGRSQEFATEGQKRGPGGRTAVSRGKAPVGVAGDKC